MVENISEDEVIDIVMSWLYNNGNYRTATFKNIAAQHNWSFSTKREFDKFERACLNTSWISITSTGEIYLIPPGMEQLEIFGTYSEYKKAQAKEHSKKTDNKIKEHSKNKWLFRIEFVLKNTNLMVTIFLGLSTTVLTIFSISDRQERKLLEQKQTQLTKEHDSLKQVIDSQQKIINKKSIIDSLKK